MRTKNMWGSLEAQSFPSLPERASVDRDCFVLLDAYLRGCMEEWWVSGGQLSARSIVLLDDCARTITKRFSLLNGEGQSYFGQFRKLARRILRGVDVDRRIARLSRKWMLNLIGSTLSTSVCPKKFE